MNLYYDILFGSDEGTSIRKDFLLKYRSGNSLIEFGCGTGDLLAACKDDFKSVLGVDMDASMIESAQKKYPEMKDAFLVGSFTDYQGPKGFDTLVCVGDSINYNLNEASLRATIETFTQCADTIILDAHHPFRLEEFEEGYFEEGQIDDFQYAYEISVDHDRLIHVINLLDGHYDIVNQWVMSPDLIISIFEEFGFEGQVFTDFETQGILPEGEKLMFVFKRSLS